MCNKHSDQTLSNVHICCFLVRELSALSDPYCHSAWISVCVCLCATLRSNISKTKGARGSVTMGRLYESGQGLSNGDLPDDVT